MEISDDAFELFRQTTSLGTNTDTTLSGFKALGRGKGGGCVIKCVSFSLCSNEVSRYCLATSKFLYLLSEENLYQVLSQKFPARSNRRDLLLA